LAGRVDPNQAVT